MDRSEESKAKAEILQRTLESVCVKLQAEKGFTSEQVGLALSATGLKFLSEAWSGEQIVAHLAGLTSAMADMHDIDPETGQAGRKATRN